MHLHSDKPIKHTRDDLLGRKILARNIAKSLTNWKGDESLVLALNGPWGSGKSSVKNMVIESLQADSDETIIVDFNPWEISGSEELTEQLFNAIADRVPNVATDKEAKESAEKLRKWGRGLNKVARGGKALSALLRGIGVVVPALPAIAELIDRGSEKIKEAGEEASSGAAEIGAGLENRSRLDQKNEIGRSLSKLKRPFIVMIDDIDRLSSDEICLLFRLIKANCDFPNFAFLLLFDRSYVSASLDGITNNCGAEYLEKIVQVSLTLGVPDRDFLRTLLRQEVRALLPASALREPLWREERWNLLIDYHVVESIRHMRDLRRLLNSFQVSFAGLRSRSRVEVNPIDLLALEHLRLSFPDIYEILPAIRWRLVGERSSVSDLIDSEIFLQTVLQELVGRISQEGAAESKADDSKNPIEELMRMCPDVKRKDLVTFLSSLFPRCMDFRYRGNKALPVEGLHVGHPLFIDVYLHRGIPLKRVSQIEVDRFVRLASEPGKFTDALLKIKSQSRRAMVVGHLSARISELMPRVTSVLDTISLVTEEIAKEDQFWWKSTVGSSLADLFRQSLTETPDETERIRLLRRKLTESDSLRAVAEFFETEISQVSRIQRVPSDHIIQDAQLPEFRELLTQTFRKLLAPTTFQKCRDLLYLLQVWSRATDPELSRAWLREQMVNPESASHVILSLSYPIKRDDSLLRPYQWSLDQLALFLPKSEWRRLTDAALGHFGSSAPAHLVQFDRVLQNMPDSI